MKPIFKVLLSVVLGMAAFVAGGLFVTPIKHIKGRDGYVIPTDGTKIDPSKIEPDHMADFIAGMPFYIGLLAFLFFFGYATVTTMRSLSDHRKRIHEAAIRSDVSHH